MFVFWIRDFGYFGEYLFVLRVGESLALNIALILLVIVLTVNEFRWELFEIRPGYAPHNFGFNIFFFVPATVIILYLALVVVIRNPKPENRKAKLYSILIVSPHS